MKNISLSIQRGYRNLPGLVLCLLLLVSGGCTRNYDGGWNIPLVYKIDIQQGNVIDQSMIDKLRQGMDKNQVRFILGTPILTDTFHSDRWDYIYSFQKGSRKREQRHISVYFEDEKLAYLTGDIQTSLTRRSEEETLEAKSVVVPLSDKKEKGFFGRMIDKVNPWGDEPPADKDTEQTNVNTQGGDDPDSGL